MEELKKVHEHELAENAKLMQESNDTKDLIKLLNSKTQEYKNLEIEYNDLQKNFIKKEEKYKVTQQK